MLLYIIGAGVPFIVNLATFLWVLDGRKGLAIILHEIAQLRKLIYQVPIGVLRLVGRMSAPEEGAKGARRRQLLEVGADRFTWLEAMACRCWLFYNPDHLAAGFVNVETCY